ncbi:MAG TPA: hypothetical protein VHD62_00990 [Opitutaceae bacterium]|nr:hypothetical protein [Opitutaceae bacterium]
MTRSDAGRPNNVLRSARAISFMIAMAPLPRAFVFALALGIVATVGRAQIAIVSSYTENFNSLGTALPSGWAVWTSSTSSGNGTAFTWSGAQIANNASFSAGTAFRNLPGASQTWSASLSSGSDRALGWRGDSAAARDGSITFTLSNTLGYDFTGLSFKAFTPNSSGSAATIQFQYQIGTSGTFTNFTPTVSYTTVPTTGAPPLTVTTITLTAADLAVLNNQSSQITFRFDNAATTGTTWNTFALDDFSYSATAVPEPAACAALIGIAAMAGAAWHRRRRNAAS